MPTLTSDELEQHPHRLLDDARQGTSDIVTIDGEPAMLTLPFGPQTDTAAALLDLAVALYESDQISIGRAAEVAGLAYGQMIDELGRRSIPVVRYSVDDLERELEHVRTLLAADSGPLIALARVDLLRLPGLLYHDVLVPAAVWDEVMRRPSPPEYQRFQAALGAGQLVLQHEAVSTPDAPPDGRLGAGERSVIGLAMACGAEVLIDERRGRQAAADAGLHVVGVIGLLVRGRQLQLIGPVRPVIEALVGSGYHLADALTARALAVLGE